MVKPTCAIGGASVAIVDNIVVKPVTSVARSISNSSDNAPK